MSWRDAADTEGDPSASAIERRIAGMLQEVYNKIQKLEGETAQLRKDLAEHKRGYHIQPVFPYDNEVALPFGNSEIAPKLFVPLVALKSTCPACKSQDSLCYRKSGEMVTWAWRCSVCKATSDGSE